MAIGSFDNPIQGADGQLVINQLRSQNYVADETGWIIQKNGDAQFNNLEITGTFTGVDFVIGPEGIFFYNGTPAYGNLVGSWTNSPGTDSFGNLYNEGICIGQSSNTEIQIRPDLDAILIYGA
jgi:hypothetical protein